MKKEILWISLCAPYDDVAHGGGKTHNFYLKKLSQSKVFHINLITFCDMEEYEIAEIDLNKYKIDHTIIPWTHKICLENIKRKIQLINMMFNPLNKMGGATNEYYWDQIKRVIQRNTIVPDVIILQWTEMILFSDRIRKIFPYAKIIAIEEDVKFLASKRQIELKKGKIEKLFALKRYQKLYKKEINSLRRVDRVITYTQKDKMLLLNGGIKNITVLSPFFENYSDDVKWRGTSNDIIFYGAMSRQDNFDSAIWFINNVFTHIDDQSIRFVIIGNKPTSKLLAYANDRIVVTGYIKDVRPFFERSLCFVAPLVSGAGVKIKILEALSAGIPVITNDIGIEGINADPQQDFIYCKEASDYIDTIKKILERKIDLRRLSFNSKKMINLNYNLNKDAERFKSIISNM